MSLSHAAQETSITCEVIFKNLLNDMKLLQKNENQLLFSELETKLHKAFAKAERASMAKLLETFDLDCAKFQSADKSYRRVSRNKQRYMTLAGEVEVERSLYRTQKTNGVKNQWGQVFPCSSYLFNQRLIVL